VARLVHGMTYGLAASVLVACGSFGEGGVTIKGDVEGLDTLALRGDSLLAQADRPPAMFDSLKVATDMELERARAAQESKAPGATGSAVGDSAKAGAKSAVDADALTPGSIMSKRAQARGDSMARAFAAKMSGTGPGVGRAYGDTVRGVLVWQGTAPARTVVLRTPQAIVSLSGMATTGLSKLVGSEIVVRGVRIAPREVVISDFFVRAADGVPTYDGTILPDGSLKLTDGSGTKRVPLPTALQGMTGARVWVAVKSGKSVAFGLITN
jgi:hypothetical protein